MKFEKKKWIVFDVGQYVYLDIDTWYMTDKDDKCEHCWHKNQVFGVCVRKSPLRTKYVRVSVP